MLDVQDKFCFLHLCICVMFSGHIIDIQDKATIVQRGLIWGWNYSQITHQILSVTYATYV